MGLPMEIRESPTFEDVMMQPIILVSQVPEDGNVSANECWQHVRQLGFRYPVLAQGMA